jgi:hypothetical protein
MTNAVNIASLGSPLSADANGYLTLTPSSSKIFGGGSTAGRMVLSNNDGTTYLIAYGSAYGGTQSSTLSFVTNTNKVTTMNANGNLVLNGGTLTAGGTGITFPASQDASSNANTLDDYEKGTWTPAFNSTNSNASITHSIQQGSYVKIGNFLHCWGYILIGSISSVGTGGLVLTGFPFALPENVTLGFSDNNALTQYYSSTVSTIYGYGSGTSMQFRASGPSNNLVRPISSTGLQVGYLLFSVSCML